MFESLYDGVSHKLNQVGYLLVAEVLLGLATDQFTQAGGGKRVKSTT